MPISFAERRKVEAATVRLCDAVARLWTNPSFKPSIFALGGTPEKVETHTDSPEAMLPITQRPIRGYPNVSVVTRGGRFQETNTDEARVASLVAETLYPAFRGTGIRSPEDERELRVDVSDALADFISMVFEVPGLRERVFERLGWTDPTEIEAGIRSASLFEKEMRIALILPGALTEELVSSGFRVEDKVEFKGWEGVAASLSERLARIADRRHHRYDVLAFLNGPVVDSTEDLHLFELDFWELASSPLFLGYATDDLLTRATNGPGAVQLHPSGLGASNTVLRFELTLPVDAPIETAQSAFPRAIEVARGALDVLRLLRPAEDLGIVHVAALRADDIAPALPAEGVWEFDPGAYPYFARRRMYFAPHLPAFRSEELEEVRAIAPTHLRGVTLKGYDVAVKRFRDSCERYLPDDPERLLDLAIAFEAIFLNDGTDKELRYRLALRAARFLGTTVEDRRAIFGTMRALYDVRSLLAHGETLETMKPSARKRLDQVQRRAPIYLRAALLKILHGDGPSGADKNLRAWWERWELA